MRGPTLNVLLETTDLVAVEKPAGLATIPGRAESTSVLEALGAQLGLPFAGSSDPRLRVVHRLDKGTSGVLLFAKNVAAQRHVSSQFLNNLVRKEYLALVIGSPREDSGTIDAPLAPHPTSATRMTVTRQGRHAVTEWIVEQRFRSFTLVRCFPRTGRTHQLRVHLAHIGLPLAIDPLYREAKASDEIRLSAFKRGYRGKRDEEERPLIARLTLHAHRLAFEDLSGLPRTIECPLPKDYRSVLQALGKFART